MLRDGKDSRIRQMTGGVRCHEVFEEGLACARCYAVQPNERETTCIKRTAEGVNLDLLDLIVLDANEQRNRVASFERDWVVG